jgi:membrane-associated protein
MEYLTAFIDIILHLDKHLALLVQQYGQWIYVILFAIIFSETGFVVTPFLPGDSLLFVAGALAALGGMEIGVLLAVLIAAAVLGNMLNYQIGRYLGPKVFHWEQSRFSTRRRCKKRTRSTRSTEARPWSYLASCRCSAPSLRSWRELAQ